jgi:hypothetical protein
VELTHDIDPVAHRRADFFKRLQSFAQIGGGDVAADLRWAKTSNGQIFIAG